MIRDSSMTTLSVFAHLTSINGNGQLVTVGNASYGTVITGLKGLGSD